MRKATKLAARLMSDDDLKIRAGVEFGMCAEGAGLSALWLLYNEEWLRRHYAK